MPEGKKMKKSTFKTQTIKGRDGVMLRRFMKQAQVKGESRFPKSAERREEKQLINAEN